MSNSLPEVRDNDFDEMVVTSVPGEPVLVDFWAQWCGPCKALSPILEELASEWEGKLRVVKLNVDTDHKTAARFGVMTIPTLILFKDGEVCTRLVGFKNKVRILQAIESFL
ncbi:MAG: thioredoxin [Acidimicrobiales bacterium]